MTWTQRWLRGLAAAALAVVMWGSGFTAGAVRAQEPDDTEAKTDYGDVFFNNLATALNTNRDALVAAMKQAALQTVGQAVANEDLTRKQADRITNCIQQHSGLEFLGCFHRHHGFRHHGFGAGRGMERHAPGQPMPHMAPGEQREPGRTMPRMTPDSQQRDQSAPQGAPRSGGASGGWEGGW